jgi:hypothetical protein
MREENPEQVHDSTTQLSPAHDGGLQEMMETSESPRASTMVSNKGRKDSSKRKPRSMGVNTKTALLFVLATAPSAMAQNCISLAGSKQCPAFNSSSISTSNTLIGFLYVHSCPRLSCRSTTNNQLSHSPFLQFVSDTASFDEQLSAYVSTSYVQEKYDPQHKMIDDIFNATCRYQTLLGCDNINLTNTTNLYARFTTTVICNAIIQNSRDACGLSTAQSRPVCADTCVSHLRSAFVTS